MSQTLADGAMRVLAGTEGVRGGGQSIKRVSIVGPNLIDLLPPAIETLGARARPLTCTRPNLRLNTPQRPSGLHVTEPTDGISRSST